MKYTMNQLVKKFLIDQFEFLSSNIVNRTKRTAFEAVVIALHKPNSMIKFIIEV